MMVTQLTMYYDNNSTYILLCTKGVYNILGMSIEEKSSSIAYNFK